MYNAFMRIPKEKNLKNETGNNIFHKILMNFSKFIFCKDQQHHLVLANH